MLTIGTLPLRALCRLARPLPSPAQVQQGRGRLVGHPRVAVGGAGGHALEQASTHAHPRLAVERGDEVHLAGAGVGEADLDAGVVARARRPRHRGLLPGRAHALDARLVDALPVPGRVGARRRAARRGRQRIRRLLPRRHRLDVRPLAAAGGARHPRQAGGPHLHAAHRGRARSVELLAERFGLPQWQVATTATDANRFALRVARAVTGRPKILVFNGCYHGTVDETFVRLVDGRAVNRPGLLGQVADLTAARRVVEFNDLAALEAALAHGDVACVIAEPVMTNSCMVLPDPGFHAELRRLTRAAGTLLLIDETHTISTGPGGYTRAHGLEPDLFVLGKPIAGGVPASVWGFTDEVARRSMPTRAADAARPLRHGHDAVGQRAALAAMRATLEHVMTEAAYAHMEALAARLAAGSSRS
jgi:hypothetical protein